MKYNSTRMAAVILTLSGTAAFSQATECSVGTWAPDYDMLLARISKQIDAPNASASGTLSMIIKVANSVEESREEMQFRADNWSFQRGDGDDLFGPEGKYILNGYANYTFAAQASGDFHIAQQSSTFVQTTLELGTETESQLFKWMLPVGEWAEGQWSCIDDVISFSIGDQDSDGHLVEVWYRQ